MPRIDAGVNEALGVEPMELHLPPDGRSATKKDVAHRDRSRRSGQVEEARDAFLRTCDEPIGEISAVQPLDVTICRTGAQEAIVLVEAPEPPGQSTGILPRTHDQSWTEDERSLAELPLDRSLGA
jgi:hypothetical protein